MHHDTLDLGRYNLMPLIFSGVLCYTIMFQLVGFFIVVNNQNMNEQKFPSLSSLRLQHRGEAFNAREVYIGR
jgi:hypothetical protein